MIQISPSMLSADFAHLADSLARIPNADMIHLDVMDGIFVPNISFGPAVIAALRPYTRTFFDVHLMIDRPERYLKEFVKAGADGITIHYESTKNPAAVLKTIRELGVRPAIAISPDTPADVLTPLLPLVDMVLIMTVHPGFGGQKMIESALGKATEVKKKAEELHLPLDIEADGGIGLGNLKKVVDAGVNVISAGSSILKAENPAAVIDTMRKMAES